MPGVGRGGLAFNPYKDMTRDQLEKHAEAGDRERGKLHKRIAELEAKVKQLEKVIVVLQDTITELRTPS